MAERVWSTFQAAIFAAILAILKSGRDLVVLARAGTGKTSTMVEAVIRFCKAHPRARVLMCAFNKRNATELQERLAEAGLDWKQAAASTLNSAGYSCVKKAWGKGVKVDACKGKKLARQVAEEHVRAGGQAWQGLAGKVAKLATMAKITLTDARNHVAMVMLSNRYRIADDQDEVEDLVRLAGRAMERAAEDRMTVDFDDQLWFPHEFGLVPWQYDLVVVDEAQDMNASQLELARKAVKRGGRLVAVGDDRQAIYGWRGAESGFLGRMVDELGATTLPLPRTYRCGKLIVERAREIVPDYEADEGNAEGVVRSVLSCARMLSEVGVGDFILSRTNAPLLPLCLDLLRRKIPAAIQGRDIMGQLMGLVEKSKQDTTDGLLKWLVAYEDTEKAKLVKADADEDVIEQLHDRCECLRVLAPEHTLCSDMLAHLEEVFTDDDDNARVCLSSVHRAKGLERDRVWLLESTFRSGGQEDNILYVAITRARNELVYVEGEVS